DAGFSLRDCIVECLGSRSSAESASETVLRVAVEAESREVVERFSRELMPYITAGPQGTTGYAEGRPRVHPVFRYWPCLISRDAITPKVEYIATTAAKHASHSTSSNPSMFSDSKGGFATAKERASPINSPRRYLY